jgi:hypothetical protein
MSKTISKRHAKGDMLGIYQKPYTNEDYEGFARLERFIRDDVDGFEWWAVRFMVKSDKMPMEFEETTYERIVQP